MSKFSAIYRLARVSAAAAMILALSAQPLPAQNAADTEGAELLYEEALELKKKGSVQEAVAAYYKAMRMDRAILSNDDNGLIDDLKKDCEKKLADDPKDIKTLETMGFLQVVCYSDYDKSIQYYEQLLSYVQDEAVKERITTLVERLKETSKIQGSYTSEVSTQMRDERLKSWAEMEKNDKAAEETERASKRAEELEEASSTKEELENRVPQLEQEIDELQEEYDRTDRLYYAHSSGDLHDMYERRRRRQKNELAAKREELSAAKTALKNAEERFNAIDREMTAAEQQEKDSPVKSYEGYDESQDNGGGSDYPPDSSYSGSDSSQSDSGSGDYSSGDNSEPADSADEEPAPLPSPNEAETGPDALDQLIDNL